MHARRALPAEALALAGCQAGVISRAQLLGIGVTPRCLDRITREWTRLARGVYLIASTQDEPSWPAKAWAGVLLGGDGARVGGTAAAALHGLAGWDEVASVTIMMSGRRSVGPHPGFRFVRERPGVRLSSTAADPPRTRIEDTVLDLCAAGRPAEVLTWLTRAVQRRLTTHQRLQARLDDRLGLRHRAVVMEILDDVASGVTSHLEHRALTEVLRPHGLPITRLQHRTGSGRRIADAAVPAQRVLIEFDGRVGHVEEGAFRDRRRDNAHTLDGWVTLRFGWADVTEDPCAVAAEIAALLTLRGWTGSMTCCPRCPREVVLG